MTGHGKHMIHRDCIHHGWDNSFKPRITITPGETVEFETLDASSGQLSKTSTAAERSSISAGSMRSPARCSSTAPSRGDAAQGDLAVVQAVGPKWSGVGLDGQHPGLRPARRPVPRRQASSLAGSGGLPLTQKEAHLMGIRWARHTTRRWGKTACLGKLVGTRANNVPIGIAVAVRNGTLDSSAT